MKAILYFHQNKILKKQSLPILHPFSDKFLTCFGLKKNLFVVKYYCFKSENKKVPSKLFLTVAKMWRGVEDSFIRSSGKFLMRLNSKSTMAANNVLTILKWPNILSHLFLVQVSSAQLLATNSQFSLALLVSLLAENGIFCFGITLCPIMPLSVYYTPPKWVQ